MFSSGLIHTYFAAQFGSLAVSWVEEPGTLVTSAIEYALGKSAPFI